MTIFKIDFKWAFGLLLGILMACSTGLVAQSVTSVSATTVCNGGTLELTVSGFGSGSFDVVFPTSSSSNTVDATDSGNTVTVTVPNDAVDGFIDLVFDGIVSTSDTTLTDVVFLTVESGATITGLLDEFCQTDISTIIIGSPLGGSFSANGNDGGSIDNSSPAIDGVATFDPSGVNLSSDPDNVIVTYSFSNGACPSVDADTDVYEAVTATAPTDVSYTVNDGAFNLADLDESPTGGTFSFNGSTVTQFNPSSVGIGTYIISYTVTNGPCTDTDDFVITVTEATPVVTGFDPTTACAGQLLTIEGENFTGTVTVTFQIASGGTTTLSSDNSEILVTPTELTLTVPSDAVSGSISISVDGTTIDGFSISIAENPPVFNNLTANQVFCFDDPSVTLSASPAGGTFSGTGVSNGVFNPSSVGASGGDFTITYTVSNACGTDITTSLTVTVVPDLLVSVTLSPSTIGQNSEALDLSASGDLTIDPSTSTGGIFSGTGVSNNSFDPSGLALDTYTITYTFVDASSGCSDSETFEITVSEETEIAGIAPEYCDNDPDVVFGRDSDNFPVGQFPNMNIVINDFGPFLTQTDNTQGSEEFTIALSQVGFNGLFTVGIEYFGGSGGSTLVIATIALNSSPDTPTFSLPKTVFCPEEGESVFSGDIAGGTFLIDSDTIVNGIFDPADYPAGTYDISYVISNGSCESPSLSQQITIQATTPPTFVGLDASYCSNESSIPLTATPSGGTFSGDGIVAGTDLFSPSLLGTGIGSATISYSYIDGNSCQVTGSETVTLIDPDVSISFSGLPTEACVNDDPITLTPSLSGGTFSVLNPDGGSIGISGNDFDPVTAGTGLHTVTYSLVNSNPVCTSTVSESITINDLPSVSFPSIDDQVCVTETSIIFSGTPQGGSYEIRNSSDVVVLTTNSAILDPSSLGVGNFTVSYTVTDATTNCSATSTAQSFEITDPPTISFSGPEADNQYCSDDGIQTLTGSPSGGTFSGDGIISSTGLFDPSAVTGSSTQITYTFSENGCQSTSTLTYTVDGPPSLFIGGINDGDEVCIGGDNIELTGLPVGGTFTILNPDNGTVGIENDTLKPAIAGTGTHEITYAYTDPTTSCSNTITIAVNVLALPTPSFSGLDAQYCDDAENVSLVGTPDPGADDVFSILNPDGGNVGVFGTTFSPSLAGVGVHTVTYTFTDDNGCVNTFSQDVEVLAQPMVELDDAANQYVFCEDDPVFTFTASPPGGTYTGAGISFGTTEFDPSVAGAGTFDIVYSFTDGNGCSNSDTASVMVNALPAPQISGLDPAYCVDAAPTTLSTNLGGSIFSISNNGAAAVENGDGLTINDTDSLFVPADAGVGNHTVFLTNTDPITGCVGIDSFQVIVNPLPSDVSIIDLDGSYCVGGDVDIFQGIPSPSSGISGTFQLFDINGTLLDADLGTAFDPSTYDKGEYDIEYTFTDNNGCQDQSTERIIIHPNPVASYLREGDCVSDVLALTNQSFFEAGDTGTINLFQWEYLGFVDFNENPVFPNPPAGSFTVQLTVGTEVGCTDDTLSTTLFIGADPFFNYEASVACVGGFNTEVRISNGGVTDFGLVDTDTITSITLDYGDGNVVTNNSVVFQDDAIAIFHPYDAPGLYETSVTLSTNQNCDQTVSRPIVVVPSITSFPYFEDFENDQGDWQTLPRDPDSTSVWEYGTPSGAIISSAAGGTGAWATDLDGEYPINEDSWVYGPCFDLTQLARPMLSFDIWNDTQEGSDGVVVEWSTTGFDWSPLATIGDGINWYNSQVVVSQPGDQETTFLGFSGQTDGWVNARVKLDQYKTADDFRIRIAFASDGNNPPETAFEGFAFDNIFVGERSKGVLFEHFTNLNDASAQSVDEFLYDELLQNNFDESEFNPLDVVYMQYHIAVPSADVINLENTADPSARSLLYGIDETGKAQINGLVFGNGDSQPADGDPWQQIDLDRQALPDPLFDILIPPASISGSSISASAILLANEDISLDTLDAHLVIVEDNVVIGGRTLQGVLREMLPDAAGTPFVQSWTAGETANITYSWTFDPTVVDPNNLEIIVFIQDRATQEVIQAVSTRDVSIFVDVEDPIHTFSMAVFPNPASHQINLNFDQLIPETIQWQLSDALGRIIDGGELDPGNYNYQLPTTGWLDGFYFLQVGSEDMGFRTEKIIISKQP